MPDDNLGWEQFISSPTVGSNSLPDASTSDPIPVVGDLESSPSTQLTSNTPVPTEPSDGAYTSPDAARDPNPDGGAGELLRLPVADASPATPLAPDFTINWGSPPIDDDDDDDDDDDYFGFLPRSCAFEIMVAIFGVALAAGAFFYFFGTSPYSHSSCPSKYEALPFHIDAQYPVCTGKAIYPTTANDLSYSYFSGEVIFRHHDYDLVTTGAPLHARTVTSKVSSSVRAVNSQNSNLADVNFYDSQSSTNHYADSGSVTLRPNGAVTFHHVGVNLDGSMIYINGTMKNVYR